MAYFAKATRILPVSVQYICEHCDHANADDTQTIEIYGTSLRTSPFRVMTDSMKQDALEHLETETLRIFDDIRQRRLRKLKLTCTCAHCHKRQSWSSFIKLNVFLLILFYGGAIELVSSLSGFIFRGNTMSPGIFLMGIVFMIPQTIVFILNYQNKKKLQSIDEKYLPKITIRDPVMAKREAQATDEELKEAYREHYSEIYRQAIHNRDSEPESGEWKCPSCWKINKNTTDVCDCGSQRPE